MGRPGTGLGICLAVCIAVGVHGGAEAGERGRGLDWYIAVEAVSNSNVPLLVTPEEDVYFTYYTGVSYTAESSTKTLVAGAKARFTDYVDFDEFDNGEVQVFVSFDSDTANGGLGTEVKFASLVEPEGQDLLVFGRNRRNQVEASADYEAVFSRSLLRMGAALSWLDYADASLGNLDYLSLSMSIDIGRKWARTGIGFEYSHTATDYSDEAREDFGTDFFGLGFTYDTGVHLAVGGNVGYATAASTSETGQVLSGRVQATYTVDDERTFLMLALARRFIPASVGNFATGLTVQLSLRRAFNETVRGELALTNDVTQYNTGEEADRLQLWGGVSAELGRRSLGYFKVARVIYGEKGGATVPGDYTIVSLGFKYDM